MRIYKFLIIFLLFLSSCDNDISIPNIFEAKVIGIKDGDTVEVLYEKHPIIIRLSDIDCPEKKQPYGKKAKKFVSDLIFGKEVKIVSKGKKDRWGRLIATIFINEVNVNKELVKVGLAMHFKKYSKDQSYADIEEIAKKNKVGMWEQENVIEPWNYRKHKKKHNR